MSRTVLVVLLFYIFKTVKCATILALFSSLSFPDHFVYRGYISLLAQKGHSVVVMTPYPGYFQPPEMENIVELNVGPESAPLWDEYKMLMTNVDDYYPRLKLIDELSIKIAIAQLMSKQMTSLFINPNIKFDLVITEADMPILYAVAEKYNAPHISITASTGKIHQYEAKGNPTHPFLYPDVNTIYHKNLTSWQKLVEFNRHYQIRHEYYNYFLPLCEVAAKKILGLKRTLLEVEYDIDLLLITGNPVVIGNRPTVPATIYTDRLHIKPGLPLPSDLKLLLDSSTNGVVYFSLGSLQESEQLDQNILEVLVKTFQELPYTILWKIGNTNVVNKPDNVITQVWFPQQEILAHPNVKAFITHGGPRSLEEAIFYEVPIIGFPVLKTKRVFINEVIQHGVGEIVDPYYLEKEMLKATITAVVGEEKYKNAVSNLKNMAQDPFLSGPNNAVWWTEYVLLNNGARNLRSPAAGVSVFKYYQLDIFIVLITFFSFSTLIIYIIVCYISRCLRKRLLLKPIVGENLKRYKFLE